MIKILVIILFAATACKTLPTSTQSSNSELKSNEFADDVIVAKLLYFDSLLNMNKIDTTYYDILGRRIEQNTQFMAGLTKINSTGRADHYRRTNISVDTYLGWVNWYLRNKKHLRWDKDKQKVFVEN